MKNDKHQLYFDRCLLHTSNQFSLVFFPDKSINWNKAYKVANRPYYVGTVILCDIWTLTGFPGSVGLYICILQVRHCNYHLHKQNSILL